MFNILVVEDDLKLLRLFTTTLERNGYRALGAENAPQALEILEKEYIDLMVSDIMMPGMDGFELTKRLREAKYDLPVLMVTAKEQFQDKQMGFEVGTDDYMVKPVDVNEMLLRVSALLRRSKIASERRLTLGGTTLSYDALTIECAGEVMELPQKEFYLLYKLASYIGKIFTRQQLMDEIWGFGSETDPHTVDVHIARLRERLKNNADIEIATVRGLGYKAVRRA